MNSEITRRGVLLGGAVASAVVLGAGVDLPVVTAGNKPSGPPLPTMNHRYLLSCKLSMIKSEGSLAERLKSARDAGFDGVDFDEAGKYTPGEVHEAVVRTGVFVHNAINHDHWKKRFTSSNEADRKQALDNLEHCIKVSHAAGGSGVLIVVGKGSDGPEDVIVERSIAEIKKAIPLAAALGQRILFENVWNQMFYDHDAPPEQSADRWAAYVDAFDSPWVGMYHDIGNHWKYGNPGDWIRTFGPRAVKFDMKGYSRAKGTWADIGQGDLPWDDVRKALDEVGFTGWFTAETGGGGVDRLKTVRQQMAQVLGIA